jgi:hypothetical protein
MPLWRAFSYTLVERDGNQEKANETDALKVEPIMTSVTAASAILFYGTMIVTPFARRRVPAFAKVSGYHGVGAAAAR